MACLRLLLTSMALSSATLPNEERTSIPAGLFPDEVLLRSLTSSIPVYLGFPRSCYFCLLVSSSLRIPWDSGPPVRSRSDERWLPFCTSWEPLPKPANRVENRQGEPKGPTSSLRHAMRWCESPKRCLLRPKGSAVFIITSAFPSILASCLSGRLLFCSLNTNHIEIHK